MTSRLISFRNPDDLTWDELRELVAWGEDQSESYWEDLSVTELLNIYHACIDAGHEDFETFLDSDPEEAIETYNLLVSADKKITVNCQLVEEFFPK